MIVRLVNVGLISLLLLAQVGWAQPPAHTKIYFFNASGSVLKKPFTLLTTLNVTAPIRLRSQESVLLETDADSLAFIINGQPEVIPFERGQTYYYVVSSDYTSAYSVNEVSRRVYLLTTHINKLEKTSTVFLSPNSSPGASQ